MFSSSSFYQSSFSFYNIRTYLFSFLFVLGNLLLPQLCHLVPSGGMIFLPIYFFTLTAAYKFGLKVGVLTALLSPLLNYLLFGMPPAAVLPAILVKSFLLAGIAAFIANRYKQISILHLVTVVLGYQAVGSLIEWMLTQNFGAALQDFTIGIPGMLLQIFGGYLLLKKLALYEY